VKDDHFATQTSLPPPSSTFETFTTSCGIYLGSSIRLGAFPTTPGVDEDEDEDQAELKAGLLFLACNLRHLPTASNYALVGLRDVYTHVR
jgi:hypothetical protein